MADPSQRIECSRHKGLNATDVVTSVPDSNSLVFPRLTEIFSREAANYSCQGGHARGSEVD